MPDDKIPRKPKTPRGIEARLRRGNDGKWTWHYRVRWLDPATKTRRAEELDTLDEAEDFRAHLRLARRRGQLEDLTRGERTLADFVETTWWPNYAARRLEANTLKTYAPVWNRHLHPRVGHLQLRELNPPTVQRLREQMQDDNVGLPTIRRALAILQGICRYAVTVGEMTSNPVREVEKPPVTRQLAIVAISPTQVEKLRRTLLDGYTLLLPDGKTLTRGPDIVSATLVTLMAYEGLRPEEALALEDRHVRKATLLLEQKLVDGQIVTGQKTGRRRSRTSRSPHLWAPVRADLEAHHDQQNRPANCALLFPRPSDHQPWLETDWRNWRNRRFKPAVAAAGLPIGRPYDLRHAAASLLIAAGTPLTEVAAFMGHSVSTLAEHYAHVIADLAGTQPVPVDQQIHAARVALNAQNHQNQ